MIYFGFMRFWSMFSLQDASLNNVPRLQEYKFAFRIWKVWNVGGAILFIAELQSCFTEIAL